MSQNIMTVSNQWANRPDDQRYLTIDSLHAAVLARRTSSRVTEVSLEHLQVMPATDAGDSPMVLLAPDVKRGQGMAPLGELTNYAFGQLAAKAGAPAGYLRSLPPMLAASAMQWSLETKGLNGEDGKVLTRVNGHDMAACVTSPTYGRIWDDELTGAIQRRIDPTVWKVPGASYAAKDPKRATTLYASDRDVFLFLVNEQNAIEVPGEGPKFRGFYAWNSEVGAATFGLATFLYDYVCDNRIIWGATEFSEVKIRHTSGAPMRFVAEVAPALKGYLDASPTAEVRTIKAAQEKVLGKDKGEVVNWLRARGFAKDLAGKAYDAAEKEGIRNPRSLWGAVSGITEVAHTVKHTDERIDLERKGSELLKLVREFA